MKSRWTSESENSEERPVKIGWKTPATKRKQGKHSGEKGMKKAGSSPAVNSYSE